MAGDKINREEYCWKAIWYTEKGTDGRRCEMQGWEMMAGDRYKTWVRISGDMIYRDGN